MIRNLFPQQGALGVEFDKCSGDPLEYQCFSETFKRVVERKIRGRFGSLTH